MFEIIIPISGHLHLVELERESLNIYYPSTVSAELQQGLPNVFYHTTGVFECLLDYYTTVVNTVANNQQYTGVHEEI